MLKTIADNNVTRISLTGLRALAIIGLLTIEPRSIKEIQELLVKMQILDEDNCDYILRIDMNTIKHLGCEILRPIASNGYKYIMTKHPFCLKITKEEVSIIRNAYRRIKNSLSIGRLIQYDRLFKKISEYIDDDEIREELLGISVLKHFNKNFIGELLYDCRKQNTLQLVYKRPNYSDKNIKKIVAKKLLFKNDKIYLCGYDCLKKETVILNIQRIQTIFSRSPKIKDVQMVPYVVRFFTTDFGIAGKEDEEKIVEILDNGYIVEGEYYNEFTAIQRILSFGPKCTVISPYRFKIKIIKKLKEMRKIYG